MANFKSWVIEALEGLVCIRIRTKGCSFWTLRWAVRGRPTSRTGERWMVCRRIMEGSQRNEGGAASLSLEGPGISWRTAAHEE